MVVILSSPLKLVKPLASITFRLPPTDVRKFNPFKLIIASPTINKSPLMSVQFG